MWTRSLSLASEREASSGMWISSSGGSRSIFVLGIGSSNPFWLSMRALVMRCAALLLCRPGILSRGACQTRAWDRSKPDREIGALPQRIFTHSRGTFIVFSFQISNRDRNPASMSIYMVIKNY